ncbi:hypothetical protein FBQ95_18745 [Chloroflexi bacterium CFX3]|nr:hypothetical protein [Chloroflexi bacterium CFX3]
MPITPPLSCDPYGVPYHTATETPLGFTGEHTDPNGLLHLRARYYAPPHRLFLTRDAHEGVSARSAARNGYAYVEGNPTQAHLNNLAMPRRTPPSYQIHTAYMTIGDILHSQQILRPHHKQIKAAQVAARRHFNEAKVCHASSYTSIRKFRSRKCCNFSICLSGVWT